MIGLDVERSAGGRRRKSRSKRTTKQQRKVKRKRGPRRGGGPRQASSAAPAAVMNYGPCFWNNYRRALEWQGRCLEGHWRRRARLLQQQNDALRRQLSLACPQAGEVEESDPACSSQDEGESTMADESGSAGLEYEVSQEFMDFIEISLRHKQSLNQSKKNSKENKKETQSVVQKQNDSSKEVDTWVAPERDGGRLRTREMGELYGCESAKIHGMETAMHLGFMRKCDRTKPIMWPVLPLSASLSFPPPPSTSCTSAS